MQDILKSMDKIIVDQGGSQGVVSYLPLNELIKQRGTAKTDPTTPGRPARART